MTKPDLAAMRRNYAKDGLHEAGAPAVPLPLFERWLEQALHTEQPPVEPNAMVLSTVDSQGQPQGRVMLLKAVDEQGFVFYSNYQSDKGQELAAAGRACLTFFWPALERQVRVTGRIEQVSAAESDAYYAVRPVGSRLGAWASPQSKPVSGREELEQRYREVEQHFAGQSPQRPPHWGGYRLLPERIEFWQGRPSRMHDRLDYRLQDDGQWLRQRLAP